MYCLSEILSSTCCFLEYWSGKDGETSGKENEARERKDHVPEGDWRRRGVEIIGGHDIFWEVPSEGLSSRNDSGYGAAGKTGRLDGRVWR